MKRLYCGFLFLVLVLAFGKLSAQEYVSVSLQVPAGYFTSICPPRPWNELPVEWLGTTDKRPGPQVGIESKKGGKDPIAVHTQVPLSDTVDAALRGLLSQCGMKIVSGAASWKMSAEIQEFRTEVEKGLIFGKGKAKSRIGIFAETPGRKLNASVGYEIEFKKTRKKSLERLTETLNELLRETLRQVPNSTQLRSMGQLFENPEKKN